jgi:hypothetical protein
MQRHRVLFENFQAETPLRLIHVQKLQSDSAIFKLKLSQDTLIPASAHELLYEVLYKQGPELEPTPDDAVLVGISLRYPHVGQKDILKALSKYDPAICDSLLSVDTPDIPIGRYWKVNQSSVKPYIADLNPFDRRQDQPETLIITDALCVVGQWWKNDLRNGTYNRPISLSKSSLVCVKNTIDLAADNFHK